MKCSLCGDNHWYDNNSDPAIPQGILICAKCGNQIETPATTTPHQKTPWIQPDKPLIPMRPLSLHETLSDGDFINSSELIAPIQITESLVGIKVKDIRFLFDQKTFKGFFRKT